jgi:hypothetical protein
MGRSLNVCVSLGDESGVVEIETEVLEISSNISSMTGAITSGDRRNIDYKPLAVGSKMMRLVVR